MWSYFGLWQIPLMKCQQCLHRSLLITDSTKLTLSSTAVRTEQRCCVLLWGLGLGERKETGAEVLPNANLEGRDSVKLTTLYMTNWTRCELLDSCPRQSFPGTPGEGNITICPELLNGSLNQNHSYLPGSPLPLHMWYPDLSASIG